MTVQNKYGIHASFLWEGVPADTVASIIQRCIDCRKGFVTNHPSAQVNVVARTKLMDAGSGKGIIPGAGDWRIESPIVLTRFDIFANVVPFFNKIGHKGSQIDVARLRE